MKRHSFFWKLFAGNLLLIGVILFVAGLFSYNYLNSNYQQKNRESQGRMARTTTLYFQNIWPKPTSDIDAECKKLFASLPMRLTVIAADGRVLGDSQANPASMDNHSTANRPEILTALRGSPGQAARASETLGVKFRYFAEPIEKDKKIVGVVRVAMPVQAIAEGQIFIRNVLWLAAALAVAVAIVIAWLLSWIWHRPLRHITNTAREIADGNLAARASIHGSDELGLLAKALNEMRESLAAQIKTITIQRSQLSTVVQNLREGIIALDSKGRIILMNSAAIGLLTADDEDPVGRHLQAAVRTPDVLDIFHHAVATGKPVGKQIEVETDYGIRILDLHAANFNTSEHEEIAILLVIRDITKIARAAAMKTEFVANASHELRTPLATIRAAVDSMAMLEPDDKDALNKFTDMLNRHVTRLEEMTKDLLELNIAETTGRQLNMEEVDLSALAAWIKNHFTQAVIEKNINLKLVMKQPDAKFKSDQTWIRMILQNLVDNAIKFTPANGEVECDLRVLEGCLQIKVTDTGCGIAADMQDKIFERFFQVEASRSGDSKKRGTGLGLAIVKHATDRLGGIINLDSKLGKGTTITISFPKHLENLIPASADRDI